VVVNFAHANLTDHCGVRVECVIYNDPTFLACAVFNQAWHAVSLIYDGYDVVSRERPRHHQALEQVLKANDNNIGVIYRWLLALLSYLSE
jgi:hypothetical protein